MLKIEAIFRPERVNAVSSALLEVGVTGFHYQNVTGQGQQAGVEVVTGRGGHTTTRSAVSKTLLVSVVADDKKDEVVEAIVSATRSGEIGDGKIFVTPVSDAIRVRTGESGDTAI
ncbi:MAG: P-II family nitrogen regulator [SAR202 cluster bacterium]|jgi:nitrogen regulatory protein PII|nr:P-II family nitrogen regulator [SAR202 cluster bacterium AD-802-K11_MRT_200m]MQG75690.1 P-II family nitrogen regulator [SAR202 cluster bacterium]|tara:strand:+ start:998 stop:1342 length:345 start_codon:yes stop_codon:yes gene_type:complete